MYATCFAQGFACVICWIVSAGMIGGGDEGTGVSGYGRTPTSDAGAAGIVGDAVVNMPCETVREQA